MVPLTSWLIKRLLPDLSPPTTQELSTLPSIIANMLPTEFLFSVRYC